MTPLMMIASMVVVAILFVAEAARRGAKWMLAATAVVSAWLALTALAIRDSNSSNTGEAVRNYAVVMTPLLFAYFGGGVLSEKRSTPGTRKTSEDATPERPA